VCSRFLPLNALYHTLDYRYVYTQKDKLFQWLEQYVCIHLCVSIYPPPANLPNNCWCHNGVTHQIWQSCNSWIWADKGTWLATHIHELITQYIPGNTSTWAGKTCGLTLHTMSAIPGWAKILPS
jgi:hypothetical protein